MSTSEVAVFDFDGTIIRGDSIVSLQRYALKRRSVSLFGVIRAVCCGALYHAHLMSAVTAKKHSHSFLTRMTPEERENLLHSFALSLVDRAYPLALAKLKEHKAHGDIIVICSASCECYMQYVAPLLGADALLCTPSKSDGGMLGPNCRGEEKVRRVAQWLKTKGLPEVSICAAYGDSAGDAPILRLSQHPVLVNPKPKLVELMPDAEQVQWSEK